MTASQKKLTVNLYTPHSGQMVLHNCPARFRIMACGRRFGKTLAATNELAHKSLIKNASLNWWVAPTYRQTEIAFNLLSDALSPVLKKKPNHSKMRLELLNDSIIECRSTERYENLRGDGPSFVVFDEASKCPKAAWTEVVRPALADTQGGAIFISTPWGRDWFWELFQRGQDPLEKDYWSASFPTSANPFIPSSEIEEARRTLPEYVFAQEFMAIFLDDAASVFRRVDSCIDGTLKEPEFGHHYVIGWDVAKYTDYSVCTVLDADTRHVVAFQRFHGVEYSTQIDSYVTPLAQKYNNAHVVMDATGVGDPVFEEAQKRDLSVEGYHIYTNAAKKEIVDRAVVAIEQRQITYPNIPTLIDELKAFGYKFSKNMRTLQYSAPEGQHDDCVMSLCLAVHGAKLGGAVPMLTSLRKDAETGQIPQVQAHDDAFVMQRQLQMQRSLTFLQSGGPAKAVVIDPNSAWGIA
jgi:hypothetical protein